MNLNNPDPQDIVDIKKGSKYLSIIFKEYENEWLCRLGYDKDNREYEIKVEEKTYEKLIQSLVDAVIEFNKTYKGTKKKKKK